MQQSFLNGQVWPSDRKYTITLGVTLTLYSTLGRILQIECTASSKYIWKQLFCTLENKPSSALRRIFWDYESHCETIGLRSARQSLQQLGAVIQSSRHPNVPHFCASHDKEDVQWHCQAGSCRLVSFFYFLFLTRMMLSRTSVWVNSWVAVITPMWAIVSEPQ